MTWYGTLSAWLALAMGVLFAAHAASYFSESIIPWTQMIVGAALLMGGYRTLNKKSGGLRLLAGAWGLAAGVLLTSTFYLPSTAGGGPAPEPGGDWLGFVVPTIALVCLALTVLHKESK